MPTKAKKPIYIWKDFKPSKAGVYKTRCVRDNGSITNYGFRYFFKELGWSCVCSNRSVAQALGKAKKIERRDLANSAYIIQYATVRPALAETTTNEKAKHFKKELAIALTNNNRAFRNKDTGEIRHVFFEHEVAKSEDWSEVMIIPNLSNECVDYFLGIL